MKKNNAFWYFVATAFVCLATERVHAQSGTLDLVLSGAASVHAVQMGDTTVTAEGGNGTIAVVHSSGRPFIEGARATLQFAGFSKQTPSGLDLEADALATFAPEDTLLLLLSHRSGDPGPPDEGTVELAGGSGRFAGISGQCKYKMANRPGEWHVTLAKCQWLYSFPYR
jgi:hypothetical protein